MANPIVKRHFLSFFIIWGCLVISTQPTGATVANGVYAYEKGKYQQARTEWLPYAALGNPNALYNLGQLHRMGRGVETDYFKARDYYLRAAEKGHVGAQRNLGTLYYFGRIGEADHTRALKWLTKAAINNDPRSQLMVGTIHYNSEGGRKDNIQAYAWLILASQSGLKVATSSLEKMAGAMTADQITQAKALAPGMINRQLSPDDVGLMIKQQDGNTPSAPELNPPEPKAVEQAIRQTPIDDIPGPASSQAGQDNFRVQLGSFRSELSAQKALEGLKNRLPHIIESSHGNIEFADLGAKGIYYRLQLSPFETRADAAALCARLKESARNCYVVKTP